MRLRVYWTNSDKNKSEVIMEGYIKLHRQIAYNPLWNEKPYMRGQAWVDLLLMANHKDNECIFDGQIIKVEAGQRITSLHKLAVRWGWSVSKVSKFLHLLEGEKMLTQKRDTKKTLVTIVNYGLYQNCETPKKHRKNTEKTQKKLNNNDKNDKNIYMSCQHLTMTHDEHNKLIDQFGLKAVQDKLEYAENYAGLKKYKSLYLTLNNWLKKDKENQPKPKYTEYKG
jgi:DNA replication protein DnaD